MGTGETERKEEKEKKEKRRRGASVRESADRRGTSGLAMIVAGREEVTTLGLRPLNEAIRCRGIPVRGRGQATAGADELASRQEPESPAMAGSWIDQVLHSSPTTSHHPSRAR